MSVNLRKAVSIIDSLSLIEASKRTNLRSHYYLEIMHKGAGCFHVSIVFPLFQVVKRFCFVPLFSLFSKKFILRCSVCLTGELLSIVFPLTVGVIVPYRVIGFSHSVLSLGGS